MGVLKAGSNFSPSSTAFFRKTWKLRRNEVLENALNSFREYRYGAYSASHLSTTKHPCSFRVTPKEWSSTSRFPWRTVTGELKSRGDDAQTTCVWHDRHQSRDISGARPALVCTELLAGCSGVREGGEGLLDPGWLPGSSPRRATDTSSRSGADAAAETSPLLRGRFINGGSAGCGNPSWIAMYLLYCKNVLHRRSVAKTTYTAPQQKKQQQKIFAAPQSLWTQVAYTQMVPMPWLIKKLEYTPTDNWDLTDL